MESYFGICFDIKPFQEKSVIIFFHTIVGVKRGLLKNFKNRKQKIDIGSYCKFTWYGKEGALGIVSVQDHLRNYLFDVFSDSKRFFKIKKIIQKMSLLDSIENGLFEDILHLFDSIVLNKEHASKFYIKIYQDILNQMGYGLKLDSCIVTNRSDIAYISPNTGHAVCESIGEKYRDKLFPALSILIKTRQDVLNDSFTENEILEAERILDFFSTKN